MTSSSMLQFWKKFNLPQLQQKLDITATELATRQDSSDASRRRLVEESKEFKKRTPEDVRKAVAPVLRSFQNEIDALSKRSKACEADFLNLYKQLVELPDPVIALEQAEVFQQKAQRLNDVETENQKLHETLSEYNREFADIKNQEVTIKNLRERVREFEKETEVRAMQMTQEKNEQLQKQFAQKEKDMQETQLLIATKLGEAEQMAATFKAALDASQIELFDLKSKYDEDTAAKQAELDLLMGEVERSTQRAASAEKVLEEMERNLASESGKSYQKSSTSMEEAIDVLSRSSLETELAVKENEISQLVEDIQHLQGSMGKLRESSASVIAKLEEDVNEKTALCQQLQATILERSDYDQLKRELNIIKSTEFASIDTSSTDAKQDQSKSLSSTNKSLEMLLMEKNRSQQSENTALRAANAQLNTQCNTIQQEKEELLQATEQQQQLIRQLEQDLTVVQGSSAGGYRTAADGASNPIPDMSSDLIAGAIKGSPNAAVETASTNSSLLSIVTSQRERFRIRNQELEAENYMHQQNYNRLQNELDSMRTDNVKLYEKIKFLQSYPTTKVQVQEDITAKRYSSQYEDNLDPFATFNKREKQRKYMNLSPHDKLTLNLGKFVLSSKLARTIFFLYMLIVHCLLYIVLYTYAYTEDCKRHLAELCYEKFGQQMVANNPAEMLGVAG